MKIRKLTESNWGGDSLSMGALADVIVALNIAQNSATPTLQNSEKFQRRCATAIIAIADQILGKIERFYAPETKRFRVTYDVKRSGVHTMEVDAETEEDARNLVQNKLDQMESEELDDMKTDFLAAKVFDSEEVV